MAEEFDIQAAVEELDQIEELNQTAWDKLVGVVKAIVAPPAKEKPKAEEKPEQVEKDLAKAVKDLLDKYGEELPPMVKGALNSFLKKQEDDDEEEYEYPEPAKGKGGKAKKSDEGQAVAKAELEAILKAERQALEKRIADEVKARERAEAIARTERDLRLKKEYLEKAREIIGLAVKPDELAERLRKLDETDPELGDYFFELLKTADHEIVEAGLFGELGTAQPPKRGDEFEDIVAEQVKKAMAADPKLTEDEAYARVIKSGIGREARVQTAYNKTRS